MSTEHGLCTSLPPAPEECDRPPSYEQALQTLSNNEPPPSYEACHPEPRPVSPVTLEIIRIQECVLQSVNNTSNYNTREILRQSTTNLSSCASSSNQVVFSQRGKRRAFVRNVYGIVSAQLISIAVVMSVFLLFSPSWTSIKSSVPIELIFLNAPALSIAFINCSICYCLVSKETLGKIVCLLVNTLSLGLFLAFVSDTIRDYSILLSVIIAATICILLTVFAVNFSIFGGILLACGITTVFFVFCTFIMKVSPYPHLVCSCLAAGLFSAFLVCDTQLLLVGKYGESAASITWESYVSAVLTFHMDLIRLSFILILLVSVVMMLLMSLYVMFQLF